MTGNYPETDINAIWRFGSAREALDSQMSQCKLACVNSPGGRDQERTGAQWERRPVWRRQSLTRTPYWPIHALAPGASF